ncbi:MAG: DUF1214 domain-containing protein [Rhodospirillales bacterium]
MRLAVTILVALLLSVAGVAAGGLAAIYWLQRPNADADVKVGAWHANLDAGSEGAGMFTRARIALNGLLALNRNETIYFAATQDDAGNPLSGACHYEVTGMSPAARWWSITLYGEDLFLVGNSANRFSFNQANLARDGSGVFHIVVANARQEGDWLPAPAAPGKFILVLRLYNPDPALAQKPASLAAPSIRVRGECAPERGKS